MSRLSEVADYRRLEAEFDGEIVTHVSYRSNPLSGQRRVRYEEKWRRGKFLGQGGYATVWLEENLGNKRLRAVKRVPKQPGTSTNHAPFDEAVVMTVLSRDKNAGLFVDFYGWYETYDSLCLVMEYIEYGDLDKHLYKNGPLHDGEASQVTTQLLEGLEAIHTAGLIHRDLKPGNILVQRISPWWVKISDFGISRNMETFAAVTFTGAGTTGYTAPEIRLNEQTRHTAAVDMWSLGCVIYRTLTNRVPFQTTRETALYRKDQTSFYQSLDSLSHVSGDANALIRALLTPDPNMRLTVDAALGHIWILKSVERTSPFITHDRDSHNQASSTPSFVTHWTKRLVTRRKPLPPSTSDLPQSLRAQPGSHNIQQYETPVSVNTTRDNNQVSRTQIAVPIVNYENWDVTINALLLSVKKESRTAHALLKIQEAHGVNFVNSSLTMETPLHSATTEGYLEVVKWLLDHDARVEVRDAISNTPLHLAVMGGHEKIVELLIAKGANIEAQENSLSTPLHEAAMCGKEGMVRLLLNNGANIEARNLQLDAPIHTVAELGNYSIVELLLNKGASIEARNRYGYTPLHGAARWAHRKTVQLLLTYGADLEAETDTHQTALQIAMENKHREVVEVLLEMGAKGR